MRFLPAAAVLICVLNGCNRASQSKEAIRESVIDYVAGKVNVGSMDVDVTSIAFKGAEADATVSFRPKGSDPGSGLQMRYTLEQKSGKWVVKDKSEASGSPHGAQVSPGAAGALPAGHPPLSEGGGKK